MIPGATHNDDLVEVLIMLALSPRVVDAVWAAVEPLIPQRPATNHPLGCHRPRIDDRLCFEAILFRLVTGCSWDVAGRLGKGSETTLRNRRDEWLDAGVLDALVEEALAGYDKIIGLDLSEVSIDGSQHKAPFGGDGTGRNPTDRGKQGWKWSIAADRDGIPIGWAIAGANRHDMILLRPTLDAVADRGLITDIETLHLDRGYDNQPARVTVAEGGIDDLVCARKRPRGEATEPKPVPLGMRWPVERTNSWLSNYGQLRRNTDRRIIHRLAQLALAVALIITIKLVKWADRWNQ
jgi:transposase